MTTPTSLDPFGARAPLGQGLPDLYRLDAVSDRIDLASLPVTVKILLENLLRHAGGGVVDPADVETLLAWRPGAAAEAEIPFMPARVLLQDFTGVPAVVDLAVMRDAMAVLGGDPAKVNPLVPADLVIDHSVQIDRFGTPGAFAFPDPFTPRKRGHSWALAPDGAQVAASMHRDRVASSTGRSSNRRIVRAVDITSQTSVLAPVMRVPSPFRSPRPLASAPAGPRARHHRLHRRRDRDPTP